MARRFRVIDTGLRNGRANIAFDAALIQARSAGLIPDTIRFLAFEPTALVGRHQAISSELKFDHCRAQGIGVARRITGGGAIYFDPGQLGWELVFDRRNLGVDGLAEVTRSICTAAASGLNRLGVPAAFRPRNDIEVNGRKLCGTGGFFDGDIVFFQGTLLITCDPAAIVSALNVPKPKLEKRGLDAPARRMITLGEWFGERVPGVARIKTALAEGLAEALGLELAWGAATPDEERLAQRLHDEEIGTEDFVFGIDVPAQEAGFGAATHQAAGGAIRAYVKVERGGAPRIGEVLITGDFFAAPPRLVLDLESALRGVPVDAVGSEIERFFSESRVEVLSVAPADFRVVLEQALAAQP